jgi:translation initiation factor IF-2
MMENKDTDKKKTLGLSRPGQLELRKTVEGGQVRQSFSHGRSKTVQVEVKKKRTFKRGTTGTLTEVTQEAVPTADAPHDLRQDEAAKAAMSRLTIEERAARARALDDAKRTEEIESQQRVIEEELRLEAEAKRKEDDEARAVEDARLAEEEAARKVADDAAQKNRRRPGRRRGGRGRARHRRETGAGAIQGAVATQGGCLEWRGNRYQTPAWPQSKTVDRSPRPTPPCRRKNDRRSSTERR